MYVLFEFCWGHKTSWGQMNVRWKEYEWVPKANEEIYFNLFNHINNISFVLQRTTTDWKKKYISNSKIIFVITEIKGRSISGRTMALGTFLIRCVRLCNIPNNSIYSHCVKIYLFFSSFQLKRDFTIYKIKTIKNSSI